MIEFGKYEWQAQLHPEFGGNLLRLTWQGKDLLRYTEDLSLLAATPEQFGWPVLFPPGRIDQGEFTFEGQRYSLPVNEPARNNHLHGIAMRRSWQVTALDDESVTLRLRADHTLPESAGFPFDFEFTLNYRLQPNRILQTLTVTNHGPQNLPCNIGFHTMFQGVESFHLDSTGKRWEILPPRMLPTGRIINQPQLDPRQELYPLRQILSGQYQAPPQEHSAWMKYPWGEVEYRVDEKFNVWCIWNQDATGGFIAIEPICGMCGSLNLPHLYQQNGLRTLPPQQSLTFTSQIIVTPQG